MSERRCKLRIRLTMLSDWSVGSGSGRQGSLDSVVERDADGLPFVPATTLRGIWRDAAEQLAYGLADGAKDGDWRASPWCELVDHVFGSQPALDQRGKGDAEPIPSRLKVDDVRLPDDLREALRGRERLRQALVVVKPGVAIDYWSGRAKTDYLRFEEAARLGATLKADASIALTGDTAIDEGIVCFALASTRLVERLGGNRRRGAGRCDITIETASIGDEIGVANDDLPRSVDQAVARLAKIEPKLPPTLQPTELATTFRPSSRGSFRKLPLDVVVETPTVVAQNVLGNVVTSLDHIPGTMLLGGVARLLAKLGLDGATIAANFASGDIRVLPAYPAIDGERSQPAPLIFERLKDDSSGSKGGLRNSLKASSDDGKAYKAIRGQYCAFDDRAGEMTVRLHKPSLMTRTHNSVEDARQKPTTNVGGVFTYEAIPAGTVLKSEIWIRDNLDIQPLGDGCEEVVTIGRAKKAGYGVVRLAAKPQPPPKAETRHMREFTLYLASDLLLSGVPAAGHITSPEAALAAAIEKATDEKATGTKVTIKKGVLRTGRTEGWVARWGLPRPSYVAVQAGAVFVVQADSEVDVALLASEGLGLRRGEGFGQVVVNPSFAEATQVSIVDETNETRSAPPRARIDGEFAAKIERAAVHNAIRLRAELVAANDRKDKLGWSTEIQKPNMSQLGALRAVMAGLQSEADFDRTKSFIASLRKTDRASKWGSDRADREGGHPLRILANLFDKPDDIWKTIDFASEWSELLITREWDAAERDAHLQRYAIACLLHAAMRAHKRAIEHPDLSAGSGG